MSALFSHRSKLELVADHARSKTEQARAQNRSPPVILHQAMHHCPTHAPPTAKTGKNSKRKVALHVWEAWRCLDAGPCKDLKQPSRPDAQASRACTYTAHGRFAAPRASPCHIINRGAGSLPRSPCHKFVYTVFASHRRGSGRCDFSRATGLKVSQCSTRAGPRSCRPFGKPWCTHCWRSRSGRRAAGRLVALEVVMRQRSASSRHTWAAPTQQHRCCHLGHQIEQAMWSRRCTWVVAAHSSSVEGNSSRLIVRPVHCQPPSTPLPISQSDITIPMR